MKKFEEFEYMRQKLQAELDTLKTQEERNAMGQFSTPIALANDILQHAKNIFPEQNKIRLLDPAFGTGVFFSALNNVFPSSRIEAATGYEIDEHYGRPAQKIWSKTILNLKLTDFTKALFPINDEDKYSLIVCNPPYVRHHHINGEKERLQAQAVESSNMKLSKLAGLYCYFMALSHRWMRSKRYCRMVNA